MKRWLDPKTAPVQGKRDDIDELFGFGDSDAPFERFPKAAKRQTTAATRQTPRLQVAGKDTLDMRVMAALDMPKARVFLYTFGSTLTHDKAFKTYQCVTSDEDPYELPHDDGSPMTTDEFLGLFFKDHDQTSIGDEIAHVLSSDDRHYVVVADRGDGTSVASLVATIAVRRLKRRIQKMSLDPAYNKLYSDLVRQVPQPSDPTLKKALTSIFRYGVEGAAMRQKARTFVLENSADL